ncbi:hypothetical protein LINPERHAP1_LOCUS35233 [Linum perenne]
MSSSRNQARGTQPPSNTQAAQFPSHFFRLIVDEEEHSRMLHIPSPFSEAHPILKKVKTVLLQHDRRSWKTKAYLQQKKYVSIGWVKFAAENSITNNHVCYFELLTTAPPIHFKVTIVR